MCIYRKLCETLESPSFVGVPGVCQIGRWVGSSTVETLALSAPSPPARYTSLPLCVVGTISHDHFQMHPHGNWSSALPHPFHDHAATFVLKGEGSQLISLTWPSVVENLKLLSGNQLDSSLIAHGGIVFTHRLFRYSPVDRRIPVSHHFQMHNWPTDTDEQRASVATMVQEGRWMPQPLPLYDPTGSLVIPGQYLSALPGSLVTVKFTLTRHWQSELNSFTHRANVEEIKILESTTITIGTTSHNKLMDCIRRE